MLVVVVAPEELLQGGPATPALGSGAASRRQLRDRRRTPRHLSVDHPVGHGAAMTHVHTRRLSEPKGEVNWHRAGYGDWLILTLVT